MENMEPKKKKPFDVRRILTVICLLCFLAALVGIASNVIKYYTIATDEQAANDLYSVDESLFEEESEAPVSSEVSLNPETGVIDDFEAAHAVNKDIKGYIWIPQTDIKSVVVQGTDNKYYLNHNFYGKAVLGIPFIDYRAEFTAKNHSMNVTVYGHDAANGSYFAYLKNYKNLAFYRQNPIVRFDTAYGRESYKIIAACLVEVDKDLPDYFGYHNYIDMTESEYNRFMTEIDRRSFFNTTVDYHYGDEFLTLSTCENLTSEVPTPYRMIVVARKVRPGESYSVNTAGATENKDMIMPGVWVKQHGKANPYA